MMLIITESINSTQREQRRKDMNRQECLFY